MDVAVVVVGVVVVAVAVELSFQLADVVGFTRDEAAGNRKEDVAVVEFVLVVVVVAVPADDSDVEAGAWILNPTKAAMRKISLAAFTVSG